jgi:hypothetical protein
MFNRFPILLNHKKMSIFLTRKTKNRVNKLIFSLKIPVIPQIINHPKPINIIQQINISRLLNKPNKANKTTIAHKVNKFSQTHKPNKINQTNKTSFILNFNLGNRTSF